MLSAIFIANQHESAELIGLLGADICGELPELSETDAERSTGVSLLSAGESNQNITLIILNYSTA